MAIVPGIQRTKKIISYLTIITLDYNAFVNTKTIFSIKFSFAPFVEKDKLFMKIMAGL